MKLNSNMALSPIKLNNIIRVNFYYGFKYQINNEKYAFLLLLSIYERLKMV